MNDSRTWGVITLAILLISGYLLFSTSQSKDHEKHLRIQKEQELSAKMTELGQVETDLAKLKKDKTEAEDKYKASLAALQATADEFKKNAEGLLIKMAALTKEKETLAKEKETMIKNIDDNMTLIAKLNKKVQKLEKEKSEMLVTLEQAKSEKASVPAVDENPENQGETQAKPLRGDIVDLGNIIVHKSSHQPATVEHVNVLYGFVIISAGESDEIHKNSIINISRNNRFIAKAVVEEARENISSAVTLPEWTREEIKIGDLVSISDPKAAKSGAKF